MRVLSKKIEQLECQLTEDEFKARASALAAACQDVHREEERQAQMKASMKAETARLESERSRLTLVVARRAEIRDVQVRVEADDEHAEAVTTREDTGEVVRRRALELHERQPNLPGTDPHDDDAEPTCCEHGVPIEDEICEACEALAQADTRKAIDGIKGKPS